MRPSNKSRSRNKSAGNNNQRRSSMGNIINRVFESAGPDGKVRGTPQQIIDKYNALGRDAQVSGDRVAAENYLQHSEHYSRLLGEAQRQAQESRQAHERDDQPPRPDHQHGEGQRGDAQQEQQPHRPRQGTSASEASGLTTIDTQDHGEDSGPVDTPESRQARVNGADIQAARRPEARNGPEEAAEEPAPAKRPRTRRRAKPETASESAAASSD